MKNILILGAGKSSPYAIQYFLERAEQNNWNITLADMDLNTAKARIGKAKRAKAVSLDIMDDHARMQLMQNTDVVLNILAPRFQYLVAESCVQAGAHMISVSYEDPKLHELNSAAKKKGVLLLTEMGLDPGIDHMSAAEIINQINARKGIVQSFESYGGGLPAPDSLSNPLRYVISWNPRNVVMAGEKGAQYLLNHKIKVIPRNHLFNHTWPLEVPGLGKMEVYPNRDSLKYKETYGFPAAGTVIRGTIRYPGWSEVWYHINRLGLPNETLPIPGLKDMSYANLTEMFLPEGSGSLERRTAHYLNLSPSGIIMEKLHWLGIFDDRLIGTEVKNAAEAMTQLVSEKLRLTEENRDMVVLLHRFVVNYPEKNKTEEIISSMIDYGQPGGMTAMAKTVGLPVAIVGKLLLNLEMNLNGCKHPTNPQVYQPVLKELSEEGIQFSETITELPVK